MPRMEIHRWATIALTLASTAASFSANEESTAQNDLTEKKSRNNPRGLTMSEFNTILFSEVETEFGGKSSGRKLSSTEIDDVWHEATKFEWSRARTAESRASKGYGEKLQESENGSNRKLRRSGRDGGGGGGTNPLTQESSPHSYSNKIDFSSFSPSDFTVSSNYPYVVCDMESAKSGYKSREDIQSRLGGDHGISFLEPMYNKDDKTCFMGSMPASVADALPDMVSFPLLVQPLLPEMKIMQGTLDKIVQNQHETQFQRNQASGFHALLCAGAAKSKTAAENLGKSIVHEMQLRDDEDDAGRGRSLVSKTYLRLTENDSGSAKPSEGMWRSLFEEGIDAEHQCHDMFHNLLSMEPDEKGEAITFSITDKHMSAASSSGSSPACLMSLIAGIALRPEVCSFMAAPKMGFRNKHAQWISQSGILPTNNAEGGESRPFFAAGITGANQVVGVSDSGLDTNNCYFKDGNGDVAKTISAPIDQTRRKVVQYTAFGDDEDTQNGHGTHVVGTIVGRRVSNNGFESTGYADGIARDAKVAFFDLEKKDIFNLTAIRPMSQVFSNAAQAGAHVHSVSWGAEDGAQINGQYPSNRYGLEDMQVDEYIYDNPLTTVVVAAGNFGRDGSYTVMTPAVAKNAITVGASHSREYDALKCMLNEDYLADFSARGPTADNRTKPDIVAPGYWVLSAAAGGRCDENFEGLMWRKGTSMAAPVVAGSATLVRQYFEEGFYPRGQKNPLHKLIPTNALVKAVLLNGAEALIGVQNHDCILPVNVGKCDPDYKKVGTTCLTASEPYDQNQNFGRVNLDNSLRLKTNGINNKLKTFVENRGVLEHGATNTKTINLGGGQCNFRVSATLVWDDPKSAVGCKECLLNDLDFRVTRTRNGATDTFFPNGLSERDSKNNAERVQLDASTGDRIEMIVHAHDLSTQRQEYALVMTAKCV